jgi:hypothetical protein
VEQIVSQKIPTAQKTHSGQSKENYDHYEFTFKIMQIGSGPNQIKLSTMFEQLVEILKTGKVLDFTLTRTTLEQVFVNFAKF